MKTDSKLDKVQGLLCIKIILSFLLTIFKLLAGFFGNSALLLVDVFCSLSEFLNESVKLLSPSIEKRPGDRGHNYRHGKIVTLCLGAGSCVILFAVFRTFSLDLEELLMFIQGKSLKP